MVRDKAYTGIVRKEERNKWELLKGGTTVRGNRLCRKFLAGTFQG